MEKRLRSSLHNSADEFLSSAANLPFKSSKTAIKNLINTSIKPSSDLASTLPFSLSNSISHSISQFRNFADSTFIASPGTPPSKRVRKSGRNKKNDDVPVNKGGREAFVAEKLLIYVYVLRLCVFHPKGVFSSSDLLAVVRELHDNLSLFESDSVLLSEIANLCEEWWKGDLLGKEHLISQSLPVILARSLTSSKKVDVHRVYMLRDAFMLFDFEDESIDDLKHLLIRCVISPLYLKTEDGRKFIAFTFSFSGQLAKEVFAMIKSQIPFGRKSVLEAYGEILFRAWKSMEGVGKDEMECRFLQGLFEGAIYASSAELAASIRRVLGGFVSNRTTEGVEKVIFRLSEPVIFRSLQVANSNVRQNALHLLLDLFPLEDPDATKVDTETLLEKQFFLLDKLIMDECPDVRIVAVEGCCRTLNLFWEVIPSPTITKIITRIFDDMTKDASTEVRVSTIDGVIYLMGNPQSHEVLKVLLPRLGHLIMDSAPAVRAAIVDLLLLLNDIRDFQFHKVVQLEELLSMLANDQPLIAKKITKLLIPSYFPSKVTDEEACKRCIALIKRSPLAGARFCEFVTSEGASLKSLIKLFKIIIGPALSSAELDGDQVEGLLLAASRLCLDLSKDSSFRTSLKDDLPGEKLKKLFAVASNATAQASICNIISIISPDGVGDLFEECMSLITKCSGLSDNTEMQAEVRASHKMIWSCGWFQDMFDALVGFLEKAASGCQVNFSVSENVDVMSTKLRKTRSSSKVSSKSRDSSRRKQSNTQKRKRSNTPKSSFNEDYAIAAGVAWQIKDLILSDDTRKAILASDILERAYLALKTISEATILQSLQSASPVLAYTSLALYISLHNVNIDSCQISSQTNISEVTMDHLFHCTKLLSSNSSKNSGRLFPESPNVAPECKTPTRESQTGDCSTKQLMSSNLVKVLTAILKFTVDATTMDLIPHSHERSLTLTTEILKLIVTNIREQQSKDVFDCVKSSFTYAAKLLNIVLKTSENPVPQAEPYNLVNELFNLILSVEEFLGYGHATRFLPVIHPWISDLILAIGSSHLLNNSPEDEFCHENETWFYTLARIELREIGDNEDVEYFGAFRKLLETISQVLKGNYNVLDAVGMVFLTGSRRAFENKDFDVFLGLLRFVCVKLVGREQEELKLVLGFLQDMYVVVEKEVENIDNSGEDGERMSAAKALLEPFCITMEVD